MPSAPSFGGGPALKLAQINETAKTFLCMDWGGYDAVPADTTTVTTNWRYLPGIAAQSGQSGACNSVYDGSGAVKLQLILDCKTGRHFDGINICYVDGHVKWMAGTAVRAEAQAYNAATHPANDWDPLS